ncbi:GNAT family N-acetyltransferase [Oxalobacteraceae bacterium OM1]|nr:GNAT family N-acetyltransferase [Oxalobacteraceae bacterium OM1]
MEDQVIEATLYENTIPAFARELVDRLHTHLHASLTYHAVYGCLDRSVHTCVLQENGTPVAALVFRIEGGQACVLSEQCRFAPAVIDRFAQAVFARFPNVRAVCFTAIQQPAQGPSLPFVAARRTQDIVAALPGTVDAYLARLGKSTRTYVKRYANKLKRCFPGAAWQTYGGADVEEAQVRAIIEFNRARMAGKYKASYIDEAETQRIMRLVRQCGLVTVMTIDGKVCAGTINYRIGDAAFLQVIAHDPAYDDYGLGTLCCYFTICACIERGCNAYHFLWGRYEYKYRLLGEQRDLSDLRVYRSRLQQLLDIRHVLGQHYADKMYEMKDWMEQHARRADTSSPLEQALFRGLNALKDAKRTVDRLRMQRAGAGAVLPHGPAANGS